jgi:DEAD/DEAH box helicase domain-containing protein
MTPIAFRTDLSGGRDTKDEDFIQRGMPSLIAKPSKSLPRKKTTKNSDLKLFVDGMVWSINDNAGRKFRGGIVGTTKYIDERNVTTRFGYPLEGQWISEEYINAVSDECPNLESIVLASTKITNLLVLNPREIPAGLNLDPSKYSIRAALYSAASLLRAVIANKEEVDTSEIEICDMRRVPLKNPYYGQDDHVGELYLNDQLANGSGFVNRVFETWDDLLDEILNPPPDSYCGVLISKSHNCDSACYNCLKEYRNMAYHALLDWRLGLAYLRILGDPNYTCGLDGNFDTPELNNWLENAKKATKNFAQDFDCDYIEYGILPGIVSPKAIIVHPLWRTDSYKQGILADAAAIAGEGVQFIDTFNLSRRPGSSYLKLGESGDR